MIKDDLSPDELEEYIKKNKVLYYQGRPAISDHDYDLLEERLRKVRPTSKVLDMVGASPVGSKKVKHAKKMLSLNKTYDLKELKRWIADHQVVSMLKIDGMSCSLIYKDGLLELAKTRGDGVLGEDITPKVLWMDSVPKQLNKASGGICEIRGELYCTETNFFTLSEEMVQAGLDRPSAQRNIVAGLMGRKDNLELCRYITFVAFDYISENETFSFEIEKQAKLIERGFKAVELKLHTDLSKLEETLDEVKLFMAEGDYQVDGLVFSLNDIRLHEEMGETSHHPRYKMAFKFKGESKQTSIKEIIWSISRNGYLTPVALVEPTELAGAKISRVTLHNYGMVKQYNLKQGDVIEIIRSGEVIPKFLSVVEASANEFQIPTKCPSCENEVEVKDIRLICNNTNCPGKIKEGILNFIQKIGIDDLSSKRLDEMIKHGLVKDIADLYRVSHEEFLSLDKVKDKLANKLRASIEKSKSADLATFLSALGISGGAYNKCEKVVSNGIDNIEKIKNLSIEQLTQIESFAEKSSEEFVASIKEKLPLIDELLTLGFDFSLTNSTKQQTPITGKKICITGALSEKRPVIEARIRDHGGVIVSSVSKKTDMLLTNETDSKSSKFKKAQELSIEILSEDQLKELISNMKQ
ncbi:MAG: NAD-dependent DNA ligase LigA [Bacteriovoracaceae bacterium]|nr:NAD-dependent DNA ligase LigA [Bacteriovoracaceae bacterium]